MSWEHNSFIMQSLAASMRFTEQYLTGGSGCNGSSLSHNGGSTKRIFTVTAGNTEGPCTLQEWHRAEYSRKRIVSGSTSLTPGSSFSWEIELYGGCTGSGCANGNHIEFYVSVPTPTPRPTVTPTPTSTPTPTPTPGMCGRPCTAFECQGALDGCNVCVPQPDGGRRCQTRPTPTPTPTLTPTPTVTPTPTIPAPANRPNIYLPTVSACAPSVTELSFRLDESVHANLYVVHRLQNDGGTWQEVKRIGAFQGSTYITDSGTFTPDSAHIYAVTAYNTNMSDWWNHGVVSYHNLVDYDDFGQQHYGGSYSGWKLIPKCAFSVSGVVFTDTDPKNAIFDTGEVGYANALVTVIGLDGSTVTTNTNTYGGFQIDNLAAGMYQLQLTVPDGYTNTMSIQRSVVLGPSDALEQHFGIEPLYSISGSIFVDENRNKRKDSGEKNYTGSISIVDIAGFVQRTIQTNNGSYSGLVPAGAYTVSYTSNTPVGYRVLYPLNGPPPSFFVRGGPGCSVPADHGAFCTAQHTIENLNFALSNSQPWFQCIGNSCRIDDAIINDGISQVGFTDKIPSTALAACGGSNASISGSNTTQPGIIYSGNGPADFGEGQASPEPYNWVVSDDTFDPVFSRTSYAFITTTLRQSGITPGNLASLSSCKDDGSSITCTVPSNLPSGVYQAVDRDMILNSSSFPANRNYVILVKGDMRITGSIAVPTGSSATFIVSGDIYVVQTVGSANPENITDTTQHIQGFYSADRSFIIEGINNCEVGADRRINIGGVVVVNAAKTGGSLQNQRDLCGNNKFCPAFSFITRPDMVLRIPEIIKYKYDIWREIAP